LEKPKVEDEGKNSRKNTEPVSKQGLTATNEWSAKKINTIIDAWVVLLESGKIPEGDFVMDVKFLPCPKEDLKIALMMGLIL